MILSAQNNVYDEQERKVRLGMQKGVVPLWNSLMFHIKLEGNCI